MNEGNSNLYDGSTTLSFVARFSGLGIDQVNFLAATFSSIYIGYLYRTHLSHHGISTVQRHAFQIVVGIALGYFCFGRQMGHLFAQSALFYILTKASLPHNLPMVGLATSLGYLTLAHIYRHVYDYGNYTLDITGPLMLNTQRLSSLAFALKDAHDERCNKKNLPELLRSKAVSKFPSLLEFSSFTLSFHSILCGPVSFYKDYIEFVESKGHHHPHPQLHSNGITNPPIEQLHKHTNGYNKNIHINGITKDHIIEKINNNNKDDNIKDNNNNVHQTGAVNSNNDINNNNKTFATNQDGDHHHHHDCSLNRVLMERLLTAFIFGLSFLFLVPLFPLSSITGSSFSEHSFWGKCLLLLLFTALQRQKYYFAWKLGEASSINAGFGYNGVDEKGAEKWDLASNVNVFEVEFSTSLKVLIDNWNISTATWLRYIIYERTKNIVHVFMFSAFWHGFYPGYYVTFCTGGLFITTARLVRKMVRPYFLASAPLKTFYDVITAIFARLALTYMGFPFLVLELYPVFCIYKEIYFCMHIGAILIIILLLTAKKLQGRHDSDTNKNHNNNINTNNNNNNNDNSQQQHHHHPYHHHHHDKEL